MEKMLETVKSAERTSDNCNNFENGKDYTAPKLTVYGDISSLVQALAVNGADGGAFPFQAQS